jgi:hypothetical protein
MKSPRSTASIFRPFIKLRFVIVIRLLYLATALPHSVGLSNLQICRKQGALILSLLRISDQIPSGDEAPSQMGLGQFVECHLPAGVSRCKGLKKGCHGLAPWSLTLAAKMYSTLMATA